MHSLKLGMFLHFNGNITNKLLSIVLLHWIVTIEIFQALRYQFQAQQKTVNVVINIPNPGHFSSHFFRTNLHVELSPPQTPQRSRLISESNSLPQDTRCLIWKKIIYISAYLLNQIYPLNKKIKVKDTEKMKHCSIFVLLCTFPECRRPGLWDHWSISSHFRRLVVEEKH